MRSTSIREAARTVAVATLLVLSFAAAWPAAATEQSFDQDILEILLEDGKITEAQYRDLEAKANAEREEKEKAAAAPQENPKGFKVKYSNGLQFNRNDGKIKMKIGGRIQGDFAKIWTTDALDAAVPDGAGLGVEFRRARLYFSGEMYDRIIFKAQYDFAGKGGATSFKDLYLGMKNLGPLGTIKIGNTKEPFGLETLGSSKYITFMERALPTALDSVRHFGLLAENHILDQRMTWAAGIYAPSDSQSSWFSVEPRFNVTSRVTGLPYYADGGRRLLHIGVAGTYQYRDNSPIGFAQRPESHLAKKYVDTGDLNSDGGGGIGVELAWVHGPLSVQGEYKQFWAKVVIDPVVGSNERDGSQGAYAYASYFLTGEHRAYKTKSGVFGRVTPKNSFNPKEGGWGAWEVGARYSWLDLNNGSLLQGGEQWDVTVGINWYLYSNVRLMVNYVYGRVKDTGVSRGDDAGDPPVALPPHLAGHINLIQTRAQIEF